MRNRDQTTERVHQFLKSAQFTTSDHIIIFSGAGMSAESGISTFREKGGLWEEYAIEEVATPEAWARDPHKVLNFYNMRRKQLLEVEPNEGHHAIAELQREFNLRVITQNVDDLHERAGTSDVLHLHGELRKARSTADDTRVYSIEGWALNWGDQCELGSQLRPQVVWFGEMVPAMDEAVDLLAHCRLMIVIGSSLQVYPAASLVQMIEASCPLIVIDPHPVQTYGTGPLLHLESGASAGMNLIQSVLKSF